MRVFACMLILCGLSTTAPAKQPSWSISAGQVWALGGLDEEEIVHLPLQTAVGLAHLRPLDGWAWFIEAGVATPYGAFTPRPRIITSANWKLGTRGFWGIPLLYQYHPAYEDTDDAHLLSLGGIVGVQISDGVTAALPFGPAWLSGGGGWSVAVAPKLLFRFP